MWLDAWVDPVASVQTLTGCVRAACSRCSFQVGTHQHTVLVGGLRLVAAADLSGDGDYKLLIGDTDKRLKVFSGA